VWSSICRPVAKWAPNDDDRPIRGDPAHSHVGLAGLADAELLRSQRQKTRFLPRNYIANGIRYFSNFYYDDDVVLVGADRDGMRMFQIAVRSAHDDGAASIEFEAIKHRVVRQDGAADIDLGSQNVVWRFDDAKLVEMLNLIEPLVDIIKPAHNYFDDLNSPAEILILSVDEYTHGGPFAVFPQGEPVPPAADS
jgi:hypothetical protein